MNRLLLTLTLFLILIVSYIQFAPDQAEGGASWRSLFNVKNIPSPETTPADSATNGFRSDKENKRTEPYASATKDRVTKLNAKNGDRGNTPQTDSLHNERVVTEVSLNMLTVRDQNNGKTSLTPAQAGHQVAEATVLGETEGEVAADLDLSLTPPAKNAPDAEKLRWLEAVMVDGVSEDEARELDKLITAPQSADVSVEILSVAALSDASPTLRSLVEKGLSPAQAHEVRMLSLHIAGDHYPDIVQRMSTDRDETLRLHAEVLMDSGRRGTEFRE